MDARRATNEKEDVFIALPDKYDKGKHILLWALDHFSKDRTRIVVTHVIKSLSPFLNGILSQEFFENFGEQRTEILEHNLNMYFDECATRQFKHAKLIHNALDVAEGLVSISRECNIKKLVMGGRSFFSETVAKVMTEANPSCKIWIVCNQNLIFTREAHSGQTQFAGSSSSPPSSPSSSSSSSSSSTSSRSSIENRLKKEIEDLKKENQTLKTQRDGNFNRLQAANEQKMALERRISNFELTVKDQQVCLASTRDRIDSLEASCSRLHLDRDDAEIEELERENQTLKSQRDENFNQLQVANEQKMALERRISNFEELEIENQALKSQCDENLNRLQVANEQKMALERRICEFELAIKDQQVYLESARDHIESLEASCRQLQQERDDAIRENGELPNRREHLPSRSDMPLNEYSLQELEQSTQNFSNSLKLGEGGVGCVYKGLLREITVAIKKLHSESLQSQSQFQQEVAILSRMRHPNLVTLIGACSEGSALIYEYLPNGSLADRLACTNNTPPLTWQTRTRIIGEICLALIFLHSNRPHLVVHGDLKPENILLDANFVSKLSDFGISRLLRQTETGATALYHTYHPAGTLAYTDPEFLSTGELTPKADVYSFGITILRLLTGKSPLNIAREVQEAMRGNRLQPLIDESAGGWPIEQAKKLAKIGVKCANVNRRRRPNLVPEVWGVVEPLMKDALLYIPSSSSGSALNEYSIPSHFICPILQEIMMDPHIAADGFTYEAEAIRRWFNNGHNTSPMTNLQLPHCNLVPNLVLRSVVQEWIQQHPTI